MNKVMKEYKQSLEDLKKINDDLFYNELKNKMNEHLSNMNAEAEKVESTVQLIKNEMEKMHYSFEDKTTNATSAMRSAASQVNTNISEILENETNKMVGTLENVYGIFHELAEAQKKFVEQEFIETSKALLETNFKEIEAIQFKINSIFEDQLLYIENKEKKWLEQSEKLEADYKEQMQKFEATINQKLESLSSLNQTLQKTIKDYEQNAQSVIQQGFQQTEQNMLAVKELFKESEQNYQLVVAEQQENQQLKWTTLEAMQVEQGTTMKKWLVALSISQAITFGTIIGLYFF